MILRLLLLATCFCLTVAEYKSADVEFWSEVAMQRINDKIKSGHHNPNGKYPKNIILFIGDGMGNTILTGARRYKNQKEGNKENLNKPLFMETFSHGGLSKTSSYNVHVTDSAAGAMALLSGRKVHQYTLGLKPAGAVYTKSAEGDLIVDCVEKTVATSIDDGIAELAVNQGLNAGFVTTTRITHATPGATYAKSSQRLHESGARMDFKKYPGCEKLPDIARQLLVHPADKFKVLMGGGLHVLLPKSQGGDRPDDINVLDQWKQLPGKRKFIRNPRELQDLEVAEDETVLGVFTNSSLPYYSDEVVNGVKTAPRLVDMTKKAVEAMEKGGKGYFLLIEGGLIDQAEHKNWLTKGMEELLEMDLAIQAAREMTNREETLIIVTADHSHPLSMPGYVPIDENILHTHEVQNSIVPGFLFASGPSKTQLNYTKAESEKPNFAAPAVVNLERGGVHGGDDVPVFADGPFAWLFSGSMENTDVAHTMKYLMCLNRDKSLCKTSANLETSPDAQIDLNHSTTRFQWQHGIYLLVYLWLFT